MNEFLEFNKAEILVERRTKVHNQLITTPTSTTFVITATVKTNFTTITEILSRSKVTIEKAEEKRHWRTYRAQQQIAPSKVLESVLFPLIIAFYSSAIISLSAATINHPPTGTNRFAEQEIQLLREAFLKKFVCFFNFLFKIYC